MSTALNFRGASEIHFLFVDDPTIRQYHQKFLGKNRPTDVITFHYPPTLDIVISLDTAAREAKKRSLSFWQEVTLYMCHGLLHASGYDDILSSDCMKMRQEEFRLLSQIL